MSSRGIGLSRLTSSLRIAAKPNYLRPTTGLCISLLNRKLSVTPSAHNREGVSFTSAEPGEYNYPSFVHRVGTLPPGPEPKLLKRFGPQAKEIFDLYYHVGPFFIRRKLEEVKFRASIINQFFDDFASLTVIPPNDPEYQNPGLWDESLDHKLLDGIQGYGLDLLRIQENYFPCHTLELLSSRLQYLCSDTIHWSTVEHEAFLIARSKFGTRDSSWGYISKEVDSRTTLQCRVYHLLRRSPYTRLTRSFLSQWTMSLDDKLVRLVKQYGLKDMFKVKEAMGGQFSISSLKYRYQKLTNPQNTIYDWNHLEDRLLINTVEEELLRKPAAAKFWITVHSRIARHIRANNLALNLRTSTAYYGRYNLVNPHLKHGALTPIEKESLLKLVEEYGQDFDTVSRILKTRTPAFCKTIWYRIKYPELTPIRLGNSK